jgi:eukaryotic-like serine/threonine-protein kinase
MRSSGDPSAPKVGAVLDEAYQLTRLIAEGGMATVFEAIQLKLERRVAVKVMSGALVQYPEAVARFRRELKITSQLAHPNIVQMLDFGATPGGRPYLVTEYLEGEDLELRLGRMGRLPLSMVLSIVRQIVSALAAIHAKAIVHRDLKPANVLLLTMDGAPDFVKLLDFGISKVTTSSTQLTHPSSILGTPGYISPEQAAGRSDDVNHRSDQWALAALVWHMLAGSPPFTGAHLNELLERVMRAEPPPLSAAVPDLPAGVETVLRRALAKRQAERFATVAAFWRALETGAGA